MSEALIEGQQAQPRIDFSTYGAVESVALSRIQKLTGTHLARNWLAIPHVTHFDEIDVTALEAHRQARKAEGENVSLLAYVVKATVRALQAFPKFNASLDLPHGQIIYKKYYHIGIATDTPAGLIVPVVRDCDLKTADQIAAEIAATAKRARERGLPMNEMSGGSFTISSLGNLGGHGFTPIINAPEVAILGVARTRNAPARDSAGGIVWRDVLPLSLSYDHRLINGVDAGGFVGRIAEEMKDHRKL